jgi:hypothetical protein
MTVTPADLVATARVLVDDYLPDTCTISGIASGGPDGFGGETDTHPEMITGVKCLYEPERDQPLREIGGATMGVIRHRIFLKLEDAALQAIGPNYQIVIDARGDKPAMTFEDPRRLDESNEVLLAISAKLKQ